MNLLENAARYTPAGTEIEISAKCVGNRAEIRVADNGPGLPPGSESKVFEKFFRAAASSPDARRGVGLGLAICQGMVQSLGGRITAANRPTGRRGIRRLPSLRRQMAPTWPSSDLPASATS